MLDTDVLTRLAVDVDDQAFVVGFVAKYRGLLDTRIRRITDALAAADIAAAMEAVLSLKVSSTTVGAHELAELAATLEREVRAGEMAVARLRSTALPAAAARADRALAAYLPGA